MFGYSFLRFSADSAALIVESNDVVSWFSVETGATLRELPFGRITQFSPDDKTFVIVRESKRQVLIGDVKARAAMVLALHPSSEQPRRDA
jgi:hypothetical protein